MPDPAVPPATILDCIGRTPLLPLHAITPVSGARVLVKLEHLNPTGSMKDRMALEMIAAAEADGRLRRGGAVVEYTTGNAGSALSLVCGVKGYPLHIVTSDAFAREKQDFMRLLGARVHLVRSEGGGMTERLTRDMIETARVLAREHRAYWTNQLHNVDQVAAYHALGDEIWDQTGGRVDAFVQAVGTAACLRGTAAVLRRHAPGVRIVAVEPAESPVLSGGRPGAHRIDGIGAGFVVPLWQPGLADGIEAVSSADAFAMTLRLARDEGLFVGTSSGANVVAALRVAERLGPEATVVTVACDSGMKHLSKLGALAGADGGHAA
jgi:cysteine synthase A